MYHREKMINHIIAGDIEWILEELAGQEWLKNILANGFPGYSNMDDDELETMYTGECNCPLCE